MISAFDIFSVGIGPSSSHTVAPMRAARRFALAVADGLEPGAVARVRVELFGSLALTGRGHGTDVAVVLGLAGHDPETIDPDHVPGAFAQVADDGGITLADGPRIAFVPGEDLVFVRGRRLPGHPNALRLVALAGDGSVLLEQTWYSIGGGAIVADGEPAPAAPQVPHVFASAAELLARADETGLTIAQLVAENEATRRPGADVHAGLVDIWRAMRACVDRGLRREGILPGGLRVPRRAPGLHARLVEHGSGDELSGIEWLNVWALAVNEENAAGGRVVTAPTNGAAGIVPSVLHYYERFVPGASEDGVVEFLLTASAIGALFKTMASISGAEVGCQGEVGSACSMAAAGLAAVMGGSMAQVENAAEIALEHNLGLTCDPIAGLVQIPCIERNAMASVSAVNAARMALHGDGTHHVSLDQAIAAMREIGADMHMKYKETALGGLAASVVEC